MTWECIPHAHTGGFSSAWSLICNEGWVCSETTAMRVPSMGSLPGQLFWLRTSSSPGRQFWSLWSPSQLLSSLSCLKLFSGAGQLLGLPSGKFPDAGLRDWIWRARDTAPIIARVILDWRSFQGGSLVPWEGYISKKLLMSLISETF